MGLERGDIYRQAGQTRGRGALSSDAPPPRVILLGTGDPLNDERAQAALALPLAGAETLLIDTSSGTILLRQLRRAGIALASIRHVVVSHRHFDHAGGLAPLLVALSALPDASVTVYAPTTTLESLRATLGLSIPGVESWLGARLRWQPLVAGRAVAAGDAVVTPFAVDHGLECVGVRLERAGVAIAISADTRPCPALAKYAAGADLLVHEAYGLAATEAEAHHFGHATAADAGRAARASAAKRLVLTHLRSSQHANPRALQEEARAAFGGPVSLATDLAVFEVIAYPSPPGSPPRSTPASL